MYFKHSLMALGFVLASAASARADIFRWDNGQLIPGTEGITPGPGVQLDHRELEYAELFELNLAGANFEQSNLTNAYLISSTLTNANLAGANLTNANLFESTLTNANLNGANLTNANFFGAMLANTNLNGANLTNALLVNSTLTNANLSHANLAGARFQCCFPSDGLYYTSVLTDANFAGAVVTGADFYDTTSSGFTKEQLYSTASYQQKNLQGIELGHNNLSGWDFSGQNLANARLFLSTLTNANLARANLTNAYLPQSTLTNANLAGANLTNASFFLSTLTNANLAGAIVTGAGFSTTTSRGFTKEQLYSTASYQQKNLPGIGLDGNDLSGWDLSGQDLTNAGLGASNLTNANLSHANLAGARFRYCNCGGIQRSSVLTDANFAGAVVTGADFIDTTSSGFTKEQLYSTASYQDKNLAGIGLGSSDLSGWDFSGQNLANAGLFDSTLTGANLTGADLRGARDVNLAGAIVRNSIRPDGTVLGLDLAGGDELVVRDDDGVADPPQRWLTPRPPIPINVHDHFAMSDASVLRLVFEADAWDSTISFQPGIPVQLGGTLELLLAADVDVAQQVGRTIDIFNWAGVNPTGQFQVASPYTWDLTHFYTTGEVTLTAVAGLAGDFNQNGVVDAADYTVWRDGLGTIYTQEHYNLWQANFGAMLVTGSGAADPLSAAIPEAASVSLLCVGLVALAMVRFARRCVFPALRSAVPQHFFLCWLLFDSRASRTWVFTHQV